MWGINTETMCVPTETPTYSQGPLWPAIRWGKAAAENDSLEVSLPVAPGRRSSERTGEDKSCGSRLCNLRFTCIRQPGSHR